MDDSFFGLCGSEHADERFTCSFPSCVPDKPDSFCGCRATCLLTLLQLESGKKVDGYNFDARKRTCMRAHSHAHAQTCKHAPKGKPGMSDITPLSGISGLSIDSPFLSHLLFFWLVLLVFLSCHFSANGPFSWALYGSCGTARWLLVGGMGSLLPYGNAIRHDAFMSLRVFFWFCSFLFCFSLIWSW